MARSLAHKFGQIIGDTLEIAIEPLLQDFAFANNLFLDKKGIRKARSGRKVTWIDSNKNKHDLDFVLERGGTESKIGLPIAFIESAWRRYTKHSRNKAQEIQSAIIPLTEKYRNSSPFMGVVLAGEFTTGALTQLQSLGFCVLYFSYNSVINTFAHFGIDASFDEQTPEIDFVNKIKSWELLPNKQDLAQHLLDSNRTQVTNFLYSLSNSISRYIEYILILPLHGCELKLANVIDAINFIHDYDERSSSSCFSKYEIIVKYNTGDKINASFKNKTDCVNFLKKYI